MIRRAIPLLHVSNATSAAEFYARGLGFQLEFANRPEGVETDPCYMGLSRDGVWINLSSFSGDGVAGGVVNLDNLFAEFRAKNVPIDVPPMDQTWGSREMYVKDADGNCLRFIAQVNSL
jgi:uncharacterized glyoxalase superfamily protein PhnB